MWVGNRLAINCSRTEEIEVVLSSQKLLKKHIMYSFLEPWLGTGLLLSTGKKWHNRRKILTPAFHFKILEQFVEVFDKQSGVLIDQLKPNADGQLMNIYPFITKLALDVLCG
jgi:cytochrome P450 family 4